MLRRRMGATFVTGATGLLGAALVGALLDRGDRVVALTRGRALDPRCTAVLGDVADQALLASAMDGADTVFHLAAQSLNGHGEPVDTYAVNVMGTVAVCEAARQAAVPRVVIASSAAVYGPTTKPADEKAPIAPTNAYDSSKAAAELAARAYADSYNLDVAIARLTNVYGPGDRHASRLIPELVAAVHDGRAPALRSDGSPRRDHLYVDDAAQALLALAGRSDTYNIGSGRPVAVRDVVAALERVAGRPLNARYAQTTAPGPGDGQHVAIDKVAAHTGWRPTTSLDDGLEATLRGDARA
ncbi:MAG TPA: NAD(P)-dependent oxidoreductase [Baekduia sp.]